MNNEYNNFLAKRPFSAIIALRFDSRNMVIFTLKLKET